MAERKVQRLGITPTAAYGLEFQLATPAQAESLGYTDAWYADTGSVSYTHLTLPTTSRV